jgi:flagellar hook-length control protein FliK
MPSTLISPNTPGLEKVEPGSSQGTQTKAALDKFKVDGTQENLGTTGKNVEVTGSTKAQTRKDDSQSSLNSQTADPGTVSAPVKAIDPTPSFSVAGIQASSATGDGKAANVSMPQAAYPQAGQFDQKSTGVVQSQAQGENAAAYPTSLVHSAKLIERIGEAELRLGIRAGEFGSVDIRTSMVRNQFTAEISVERGELGHAMASELPSLQNRLAEQRVPMANITLQNHTGSQSTASEQQKPRDGQPVYAMNPVSAREEGPMPALVALEGASPASRLDIHM